MEGEVLVLPPCFASVGLGNPNHTQCGLWLIYFFLICLYLFAVTFRWFVISQLYNKMLRVLGCLGVLFRPWTVTIIKEPGGQVPFQLFTFSSLLVALTAGGWYNCFIL